MARLGVPYIYVPVDRGPGFLDADCAGLPLRERLAANGASFCEDEYPLVEAIANFIRLWKRASVPEALIEQAIPVFRSAYPDAIYNDEGMRLTDCCGAVSTFHDDALCCKRCWYEVEPGQGDGSQYLPTLDAPEAAEAGVTP